MSELFSVFLIVFLVLYLYWFIRFLRNAYREHKEWQEFCRREDERFEEWRRDFHERLNERIRDLLESTLLSKDYYSILGISQGASKEKIKKAYYRLAKQHHPDFGGDEEKFKEINEAYRELFRYTSH